MNFKRLIYAVVIIAGALWVTYFMIDIALVLREKVILPSVVREVPSVSTPSSIDSSLILQKDQGVDAVQPTGVSNLDTFGMWLNGLLTVFMSRS